MGEGIFGKSKREGDWQTSNWSVPKSKGKRERKSKVEKLAMLRRRWGNRGRVEIRKKEGNYEARD